MTVAAFNKVKIFMKTGKFSYTKESFAKVHMKLFKDGMKTDTTFYKNSKKYEYKIRR